MNPSVATIVQHPEWGEVIRIGADKEAGADRWTLLVAGDFCPNGGRTRGAACGDALSRLVHSATVAVVNFEGSMASIDPPPSKIPLVLDANAVELAVASGFRVLGLANNHIADGGSSGIVATIDAIHAAGVMHAGAGTNATEALAPAVLGVAGGKRLAVFSVCDSFYGEAGPDTPGFASMFDPGLPDALGAAAAQGNVVVVCVHCGVEDMPLPPPRLRAHLHSMVNSGAKMVFCAHPHVAQGFESYGDALIFHSLGNFLFDRLSGRPEPKRDISIVAVAEFEAGACVGCTLIPIEQHRGQTRLMRENSTRDASEFLEYLLELHEIVSSSAAVYTGCWQESALQWFRHVQSANVAATATVIEELEGGVRSKTGQTMSLAKQLLYVWLPESLRDRARAWRRRGATGGSTVDAAQSRGPLSSVTTDTMSKESRRQWGYARAGLSVASERWTSDEAMALLAGETRDVRSAALIERTSKWLEVCSAFHRPGYDPFKRD